MGKINNSALDLVGGMPLGHNAVIGGNIWITEDVPAFAWVVQSPKKYF